MARPAKVTRTILTTTVVAKGVNLVDNKLEERKFTIPRTYKTAKELNKYLANHIDNDEWKTVSVVETVVNETLYGMDEDKFIANAEILPPRSIKKSAE